MASAYALALFEESKPVESLLPADAVMYLGWDGTDRHQAEWEKTSAYEALDKSGLVSTLVKIGLTYVPGKTNEHKTALELLKILPLEGTLFTGDAAFTQRDFCEAVIEGGGDYFLTVKDNQPTLEADIRAAFGPAFSPSRAAAPGRGGRLRRVPREGARPA